MLHWHCWKSVYELENPGFKSWYFLHEYTVCMLLKLILDPRPTIKPKVTYMFAFLPSSASLRGAVDWPTFPPSTQTTQGPKKKADVWLPDWVSALKSCPSPSSRKLGLWHLNWQTQCSIIQKKQYWRILFIFSRTESGVYTPCSEINDFFWCLYL